MRPGVYDSSVTGETPDRTDPEHATQVLLDMSHGDAQAANRLLPLVYDELRATAARMLASERPGHTLPPTALVHEAYVRMIDQTRTDWANRAHFCGVAAGIIRRILVDHARARLTAKRGGDRERLDVTDMEAPGPASSLDLLSLDEQLEQLEKLHPRHRQVIELRFFGGLSVEETARVLGVSPETVKLDWRAARAWLQSRLRD
jgi:RNA polymerase sigma-70 factor, ECF subfamily